MVLHVLLGAKALFVKLYNPRPTSFIITFGINITSLRSGRERTSGNVVGKKVGLQPHVIHINSVHDALMQYPRANYVWDSFHENVVSHICYKIPLRLNHYNFRTVKAINFLLSTLHTASFLYGKIHFGVLYLLRASIATFDTPPGSNPPYLSV